MTTAPDDRYSFHARRFGVRGHGEYLVFMREDCFVCRSEGLAPRSRVWLRSTRGEITATLIQVSKPVLHADEAGLSDAAWTVLGLAEGDMVTVAHPAPLGSTAPLRRRIFGNRLNAADFDMIIADVALGRYSDVETAAFLTACTTLPLDDGEVTALTHAMVAAGERMDWNTHPVLDKHSVGGLPGNRTTPIVVSVVAAHGLIIPKTSSKAITSPAGTADCMATLTSVELDGAALRRVVRKEGGCLAWGGAIQLSPADDILIRVERALDIDPEGQLVASILSKKIAAGSTHVVIDMPVGPTAKVRDAEAAARLALKLKSVAGAFGLQVTVVTGEAEQPIGRGIGPALEARDVLAVLGRDPDGPRDLHDRSCLLAGALLEIGGVAGIGEGARAAAAAISDGRALAKFEAICRAQGGLRTPPLARHRRPLAAAKAGRVVSFDNRRLARLAKLAGAPDRPAAGLELAVRLGDAVAAGQPLLTVHADNVGELRYAFDYARANPDLIGVAEV